MIWQDVGFTVGSVILTFGVLPMVWHPHKPPLTACIPIVIVLYFFAWLYLTLGFILAPTIEGIQATLWLLLAVQRKVSYDNAAT